MPPQRHSSMYLLFYLLVFLAPQSSWSFTSKPLAPSSFKDSTTLAGDTSKKTIQDYDEAFSIIDKAAISGEPIPNLYQAVRFIENNSYKLYSSPQSQQDLWNKAQGSWKLQLSTGDPRTHRTFHKPPVLLPFSFAMIHSTKFGNGIGLNESNIWLSLIHNLYWHARHRRMVVCLSDVYLFGNKITQYLPPFVKEAFNKTLDDYNDDDDDNNKKHPPPTFVLVGCSNVALVARGNQSGGLAIWTRLPNDIRQVAYKDLVGAN